MLRLTALLSASILIACAAPAAAVEPIEPPAPEGSAQAASPAGKLVRPGASAAAASKHLWATVNICDTFESPDAMGIRASMPGNGTRQRMFMRFTAQWYSSAQGWVDVPNGKSRWLYAGSARYKARQAGYTFNFQTPPFGRAYILRGIVEYQWRSQRRAKRSGYTIARERTTFTASGMRNVRGGDPKGTSKAMCAIANVGGA